MSAHDYRTQLATVASLSTRTYTYTCPTSTMDEDGMPHTIIGCGRSFEAEPDADDGLVDCPLCGIFFNPALEDDVVVLYRQG